MARAVEQIDRDLAALEEAIALMATELYKAYSKYLTSLGQAVRQQLMLACYQVCTHGYPESFLSLSFNERQQLQVFIKELGGQAQAQLLSQLEELKQLTTKEATDKIGQTPQPADPEQPQEPPEDPSIQAFEMPPADSDAPQTAEPTNPQPTKPAELVQWQEQVEEAIAQTLQTLSLDTNRQLQQVGIIPGKLPAAVLEAAAKVEATSEAIPESPNLLNLLMETESEEDSEDSSLTRIVAINLRLSEIEFADPTLTALRNQIRNLSGKLNKIQREYHKKQRERAVAQAEAAWRSSWFDD
ncbi:MAG: hypothetical protein LDL41_19620 [Coleofasciculus sp. S288]|nr:hypothetical protein [Coleofasciculus sp. S288]